MLRPDVFGLGRLCVEKIGVFAFAKPDNIAISRPGSDLLSRVLRRSTIGAGAFHGRVRNGNGCSHPAMTTRSAKGNVVEKLVQGFPVCLKVNTSVFSAFVCREPPIQADRPSRLVARPVRSASARQDKREASSALLSSTDEHGQ